MNNLTVKSAAHDVDIGKNSDDLRKLERQRAEENVTTDGAIVAISAVDTATVKSIVPVSLGCHKIYYQLSSKKLAVSISYHQFCQFLPIIAQRTTNGTSKTWTASTRCAASEGWLRGFGVGTFWHARSLIRRSMRRTSRLWRNGQLMSVVYNFSLLTIAYL